MRIRSRKLLVALFIGVFLATAPAVVLFTMGYRYNVKKHKIEKTGILLVASRPAGAAVLLDGKATGRTTPISFPRLLPEEYAVRVMKDGYLPWEKRLSVQSGETTFARPITLFMDALPRIVADGRVTLAAFSADARRAAILIEADEWMELRSVDLAAAQEALLARFGRDSYAGSSLDWSPDGAYVLFTGTHHEDGFTAIAFDAAGGEPRSLHGVPPRPAWSMRWAGTDDLLIAGTSSGLYAFRLSDEKEPALLSPFAMDGMTQRDDVLLVRRTQQEAVLEYGPASVPAERREAARLPVGDYRIAALRYPHAFVADAKGELWYADLGTGKVSQAGRASTVVWERTADPAKALLCSDFEVVIVSVPSGERELITRLGAPVGACDWSPDGDYAVFSTNGAISAIELDARDERNSVPLVTFTDVGGFRVDPLSLSLWFFGSVGNRSGLFLRPL